MTSQNDSSNSDEALMEGLRAGERGCAEELSTRYWEAIHRFCLSYLNDNALAEDVAQDIFTKLIHVEDLPTGAVKPWLYKVARNRCLDILRRHQRSPTHNRPIRTGFDAAKDTAGPRTRMAREERREQIREIIEQMPEDYRSVLMLKHFEGFSRAEMAETLGVSEIAVKGRLVRASEYLREQLRGITRTNR
ncbi:MAG: sigma-70 family RNA polymerase sigma factor [Phycisphaerales bacterium]|nr:sigma-70 family RNA polymerase sigma factor [Phycisphaerales bacterium]